LNISYYEIFGEGKVFDFSNLPDWVFDNARRLLFPEDWISLDLPLSKTELITLIFVDRQGDIIMSALSEYIGVPMSTATGIVDRLVKDKYLLRERNDEDRRIVTIRLTEKGKTSIRALKETISGYAGVISEALTAEEQVKLAEIVGKIVAAIGRKAAKAPPNDEHQNLRRIPIA
jgi:MarR family transcriptional regulator, organic hydroperoxide resistance regulator